MSMRITKEQINYKVSTIAKLLNAPTEYKDAKENNQKEYLGISSHAPGDRYGRRYQLVWYNTENGGIRYFNHSSRIYCGSTEFWSYLSGIVDGLEQLKEIRGN